MIFIRFDPFFIDSLWIFDVAHAEATSDAVTIHSGGGIPNDGISAPYRFIVI